jgi:hypothetical protein
MSISKESAPMNSEPSIPELHARLERVEKNYLRWKRIGIAAMVVAIALIILNAQAYSQRQQGNNRAEPPREVGARTPTDDKSMATYYSNFFQFSTTPEEFFLDFGVNNQPVNANAAEPVKLSARLIMSPYMTKRLLAALQYSVNRYETNYGEIEIDPKKRLRSTGAADKSER